VGEDRAAIPSPISRNRVRIEQLFKPIGWDGAILPESNNVLHRKGPMQMLSSTFERIFRFAGVFRREHFCRFLLSVTKKHFKLI
jgi:hypothetical protein